MEIKYSISKISSTFTKNLLRLFLTWKSNSLQLKIHSKYKKLKKYTVKLIKTRQIPSIKIHTLENTKNDRPEKYLSTQTNILNTSSEYPKSYQRPCSVLNTHSSKLPPKKPLNLNNISILSENSIRKRKPETEEIAVVSSSLASQFKAQNSLICGISSLNARFVNV